MTDDELLSMYRLKSIVRYNNKPKLTEESVAEHSFFVAMIGLKACDELNVDDQVRLEVLLKALLHDMPEMEINDITHDVKCRLHLEEFLAKYEDEYYQANFPDYAELMKRHDTLADRIVDYADAMSVKQFCLHEMSLGNSSDTIKTILADAEMRVFNLANKIQEIL